MKILKAKKQNWVNVMKTIQISTQPHSPKGCIGYLYLQSLMDNNIFWICSIIILLRGVINCLKNQWKHIIVELELCSGESGAAFVCSALGHWTKEWYLI